ncbi:uncharacterized protein FIESC28_11412 [Fusarium coffeatum]|uniref:Clathrin light chain n=1 Tax=Fusarium coffeatum TaxID=231269 RepID=A0A366QKE7_9HYPO|nr:uncharacterized protein FIESC28_11412 [Fusarium coffeatum]RBR05202.1 hypothetical protein FIESC28_11412 [Fusarium coffeatum]
MTVVSTVSTHWAFTFDFATKIAPTPRTIPFDLMQTKKNLEDKKHRRAEWETEQTRFDEELNAKVKAEREQMKERLTKVDSEKATEVEKRAQETADEALRKKTEDIGFWFNDKDETVAYGNHKDNDNDDIVVSCSTESPQSSPKSVDLIADLTQQKQ